MLTLWLQSIIYRYNHNLISISAPIPHQRRGSGTVHKFLSSSLKHQRDQMNFDRRPPTGLRRSLTGDPSTDAISNSKPSNSTTSLSKSEKNFAVKRATAEDILNLFSELDSKKTGVVSVDEVVAAGKAGKLDVLLHKDTTHDAIRGGILKFVKQHDHNISIEEFFEWVRYREDQIDVAFKHLKAHGNGQDHDLESHASILFGRQLDTTEAKAYMEQMLQHHQYQRIPFKKLFRYKKRFSYEKISREEINSMFHAIDADANGFLTLDELVMAAKAGKLGILHHRDACTKYLEAADTNHDGKLSIKEFHDYVRKREVVIADLFWHMDKHMTGHVSADELKKYASTIMGKEMKFEEAVALISQMDEDRNGTLELKELLHATLYTTGRVENVFKTWDHAIRCIYDDGPPSTTSSVTNFLAGYVAGIFRCTMTAPFGRISMVMRAGGSIHTAQGPGISSAMRSMVVLEGVRSLWRGNGMMSATYGIEAAVMQFFVGQLKAAFAKDPANTTMAEKFFIGGTAGLIGISTVFPSYVLQARTAVAEPGRFQSYADLIRTSAAVDGPKKAFYSGYSAAAIRKFPESGLHFLIYQVLKSTFVEPGQYPSVHQSLGFGAIGGFVRCCVVFPLYNVQTKLMTQGVSMGRPVVYTGVFDCFRKMVFGCKQLGIQPGGISSVYTGFSPMLLKTVPALGLEMAAMEAGMQFFRKYTG